MKKKLLFPAFLTTLALFALPVAVFAKQATEDETVNISFADMTFDVPSSWSTKDKPPYFYLYPHDDSSVPFMYFYSDELPGSLDNPSARNGYFDSISNTDGVSHATLPEKCTINEQIDGYFVEASFLNDGTPYQIKSIAFNTPSNFIGVFYCADYGELDEYSKEFDAVLESVSTSVAPDTYGEKAKETLDEILDTINSQSSNDEGESTSDVETGAFEADLGAGFYTAGVDIPKGNYNLTAISGSGNVISKDGNINEIMAYPADKYYIDTFNGANFKYGGTLFVGGDLVLHIKSDEAETNNMKPRQISGEVATDLSAGNYTAGTNFPAGTYNIVGIQGSGNVISGEADVNEIISDAPKDGYVTQINNVKFSDGDSLELSGCSVRLEPIGE